MLYLTLFISFEVIAAIAIMIDVFWDVMSCNLAKEHVLEELAGSNTGAVKHLLIEAASSSVLSVYVWQTALGCIPGESNVCLKTYP